MQSLWISAAVRLNWPQLFMKTGLVAFPPNWVSTWWRLLKHFNTRNGFAPGGRSTLPSRPSGRSLGEIKTSMLVSILIPCYNAERWVAQAIESALAQTWPDKEVIVVDDGSTDGSLGIIQAFADRIRWEAGPNCGGNATRNRPLRLARGARPQDLD